VGRFNEAAAGLGGLGLSLGIRAWMSTLNYQTVYFDTSVDPANANHRGPAIYLFWHEYISFMFYLRGHCDVVMLLSQHRDAELLSRAARQMGFATVRGSSTRGGVQALKAMLKSYALQCLTLTPDGPQGPRRKLAPGCIYLSSRLQIPLVPLGLAYQNPWRIRAAWDQHAVPRPGSNAYSIMGPRLQIPPDLDREGLSHYQVQIENWLNWITDTAETWARTGHCIGEPLRIVRAPRPLKPLCVAASSHTACTKPTEQEATLAWGLVG
jgi:lysophospholipid acyltransferase (LPLAT)-like uncharacterized protein